ncbi:hypothetical protein DICVIV_12782 [Dictyocaulus viviparus]|uniref:Uncharacterized protein n=1 Tax=Dictyocaulus viviparus TaxID=29172 RepID=A0A0D8XFW4_DICVI|nr:hypothetical protein DICVIV_12782 [Dictyocaulus viviparus]
MEKDLSNRVGQELSKMKELYNNSKVAIKQLEEEKNQLNEKVEQLSSEFEKLKEDQRPSIRTELERRYEDLRYRLNTALEKIHKYELVIESAKKSENTTYSEVLQQDLIQLKEYNEHLERQFQTQTDIIETLKNKLIEQKAFADLIQKLSMQRDVEVVIDELNNYIKSVDRDAGRLAENLTYILRYSPVFACFQCASTIRMISPIAPLEIHTSHHKTRPYNSVDSSRGRTNSSEDNSQDSEDLEWNESRKKQVQCDAVFGKRAEITKSS